MERCQRPRSPFRFSKEKKPQITPRPCQESMVEQGRDLAGCGVGQACGPGMRTGGRASPEPLSPERLGCEHRSLCVGSSAQGSRLDALTSWPGCRKPLAALLDAICLFSAGPRGPASLGCLAAGPGLQDAGEGGRQGWPRGDALEITGTPLPVQPTDPGWALQASGAGGPELPQGPTCHHWTGQHEDTRASR